MFICLYETKRRESEIKRSGQCYVAQQYYSMIYSNSLFLKYFKILIEFILLSNILKSYFFTLLPLRCDGSEATTQTMLGEIITRPKLSEKLLSKPPFRFLFDIVLEVIKVTGFASTLYSPAEVDSANVTEKTQKLSFLEKIIKLVGVQLNTMIEAKPLRIIGGYDPQNTNNFLQLLSIAAKHMPDSRNAARTVLEQDSDGAAGTNRTT